MSRSHAREPVWKPWAPHARSAERRRSAVQIARLALAANGLLDEHRHQLLSVAVWKHTEADGKYTTRYRSEGALGVTDTRRLNHEHVHPRKWLREQMLANPARVEAIMAMAEACVVTTAEHVQLTAVSRRHPSLVGWNRYAAAGIRVFDMRTGRSVDVSDMS